MALWLPPPMLARSGEIPAGPGWAFELKWDGFRALVAYGGSFRVRSRRGWDMTALLPELADLPGNGIFDGEIIAWDDGQPYFHSSASASSTGTARCRSRTSSSTCSSSTASRRPLSRMPIAGAGVVVVDRRELRRRRQPVHRKPGRLTAQSRA